MIIAVFVKIEYMNFYGKDPVLEGGVCPDIGHSFVFLSTKLDACGVDPLFGEEVVLQP